MKTHVKPEDTYDCHICRQDFKQLLGMMEHVYVHDKCGDYTCPHCQKDFTEEYKTRKHIKQIHAKEMFHCNDCIESSPARDQSSNHVMKHEEAKGLKCEAFGPGEADIGTYGFGKDRDPLDKAVKDEEGGFEEAKDFKCEEFGQGKADIGRASKKSDPQVEGGQRTLTAVAMAAEGSYKREETHGDLTPDKASEIKQNQVKHKDPDETMKPGKEEMIEKYDLTPEDQTVQAGNEHKTLECNKCKKETH